MSDDTPAAYPPDEHMLRDLRVSFETDGDRAVIAPVVPELLHDAGSARLGALGVLVDVMGGGHAIRAALPDWAVTSDLAIHALRPVADGEVIGRARALRAGKNAIVLEIGLAERSTGEPVVHSTMTFTRIRRRTPAPDIGGGDGGGGNASPAPFARPGSRMPAPLFEALGIRTLDAVEGRVEIPVRDYVRNSVGALQGGAVLCVAEAAAESCVRARSGAALVVTDLSAHYLAMVKTGPIATRTRVLRLTADDALLHVDLVDAGEDDRLLTVVTARAGRPLCKP